MDKKTEGFVLEMLKMAIDAGSANVTLEIDEETNSTAPDLTKRRMNKYIEMFDSEKKQEFIKLAKEGKIKYSCDLKFLVCVGDSVDILKTETFL